MSKSWNPLLLHNLRSYCAYKSDLIHDLPKKLLPLSYPTVWDLNSYPIKQFNNAGWHGAALYLMSQLSISDTCRYLLLRDIQLKQDYAQVVHHLNNQPRAASTLLLKAHQMVRKNSKVEIENALMPLLHKEHPLYFYACKAYTKNLVTSASVNTTKLETFLDSNALFATTEYGLEIQGLLYAKKGNHTKAFTLFSKLSNPSESTQTLLVTYLLNDMDKKKALMGISKLMQKNPNRLLYNFYLALAIKM